MQIEMEARKEYMVPLESQEEMKIQNVDMESGMRNKQQCALAKNYGSKVPTWIELALTCSYALHRGVASPATHTKHHIISSCFATYCSA